MPLYMDTHCNVEGLTAEAVTAAHAKDLEVQSKYGVKYLRYWYNEGTGRCFASARLQAKKQLRRYIAKPTGESQMRSLRSGKAHKSQSCHRGTR